MARKSLPTPVHQANERTRLRQDLASREPREGIRHERPLREEPSPGLATVPPVEQKSPPSRVASVRSLHGEPCWRALSRNYRFPNIQPKAHPAAGKANSYSNRSPAGLV